MDHHPVAALFPMLADDELADLAADIAERGLLQPIVLDAEGRILDGRNRYAACKMASVELRFETYDGNDPDGYALAVNLQRRNLTKGQQAMVVARALLVSSKSQQAAATSVGVSQQRISQAVTIRDFAPDLADGVLAGSQPFDSAYSEAQRRKQAAQSTEAKMARLRTDGADLADLVTEERLGLDEALTALSRRQADRARTIEAARTEAGRIVATVRSSVATVLAGAEQGERGLINKAMIRGLREAVDLLEDAL